MLSEASGFAGHEIMFSSNETQGREFARASRQGAIINLDDFTLIDTLERACGIPETVFAARYNPGGEFFHRQPHHESAEGREIRHDARSSRRHTAF